VINNISCKFYGERGLVNAILFNLLKENNKEENILFLETMKNFVGKSIFDASKIKSIDYFLEVSLSQFGDPDLMMKLVDEDGIIHMIFIEAKQTTYEDASYKLSDNQPNMLPDGFSSYLNVQIGLKYRFAKTLHQYFDIGKFRLVDEKESIHDKEVYWYDELTSKYKNVGRKLKKNEIRKLLYDNFMKGIGKDQIRYYFLGLVTTIDIRNETTLPIVAKDLNDKPVDANKNVFTEINKSPLYTFGYLTYQDLINKDIISFDFDSDFGKAWSLTVNDQKSNLMFTQYTRINRKDVEVEILSRKMGMLAGQIKVVNFGLSNKDSTYQSSYSYKDKGTRAKLMIGRDRFSKPHIYLGVKRVHKPEHQTNYPDYVGTKKFSSSLFGWYIIDDISDVKLIENVIKENLGL